MNNNIFAICLALGCLAIAASARSAGPGTKPAFGISFNFLSMDVSKIADCRLRPNSTTARATFLPRYEEPGVREQVRAQLQSMHASGFKELRTILFFGLGPKVPPDWFDVDNDAQRASRIVKQYASDVAAAGFQRFQLNYGVQGRASPKCKEKEFGDCFDEASISRSIKFIAKVRSGLGSPTVLPMRFELAGEQCVAPNMPKRLASALRSYTNAIVRSYLESFPSDETTISCSSTRFADSRDAIDQTYAAAGHTPAFYDIHVYERRSNTSADELKRAAATIGDSETPLLIGETTYGSHQHLMQIEDVLGTLHRPLLGIYFFPLRNIQTGCNVDVAPPYTLPAALGHGGLE